MVVLGSNLPLSNAAKIVNGLTVEPGSIISVMARFRTEPGINFERSLGLNDG